MNLPAKQYLYNALKEFEDVNAAAILTGGTNFWTNELTNLAPSLMLLKNTYADSTQTTTLLDMVLAGDADKLIETTGFMMLENEQIEELKNKCTWEWTTQNGVNGQKVTGPNGNSIFLPAAGYRHCGGFLGAVGSFGSCWASTSYDSDDAWYLYFYSSEVFVTTTYRCFGLSVRLVQGNADSTNPDDDIVESGYVDLGLSVKWATANVGADAPEGYGDFYTYDEAVSKFGNNLPTEEQFQELQNNCTWKWTTHKGADGYKVTGPNGKSIFLPAAGNRSCEGDVNFVGTSGFYWSSTPYEPDFATFLCFYSTEVSMNTNYRCYRFSVRLVRN